MQAMTVFALVLVCVFSATEGLRTSKKGARSAFVGAEPSLPALPEDIRALGVKLLSEGGLSEILAETQCLTNGRLNFNLTTTMCGHAGDSSFVLSWFEHGRKDFYGFRRPGLDPEGVFVDVGTYIGDTTLMMHKLYPQAKIYAFEVTPRSYFYLRWNLRLNGVPELPCEGPPPPAGGGVCAFEGPTGFGDGAPLKIRIIPDAAQQGGSAMTKRRLKENDAQTGSVTTDMVVPTMSPSQLFQQAGIKTLEYLKMDCQGCEWAATKDMMEHDLIRRINTIAAEVHCIDSELPALDRAALLERQKVYHLLKARSGPYFSDLCTESDMTYATFDIDEEVLKSGGGRLRLSLVFAALVASISLGLC